jgi:hypothetical protein
MQIDFHHGVTYVVSRLAGFDHDGASKIAYSAQYVDDAINSGVIRFDNGFLFSRLSSAHKMLDYRNFQELSNHRVWIPFHFLPGNRGLPAEDQSPGDIIDKLICRPNSPIAQDMVRECIERRTTPYALYRLGITMHVYVDTWAHQGFAGINHPVNVAHSLVDGQGQPDRKLLDRLKGYFVGEALPLGHGAVLSHPDKPFLRWGYTNGRGERVTRDNPTDFLQAADCMCRVLQRYLLGDADADVEGLPEVDRTLIGQMLRTITDDKGDVRHQKWLAAIAAGKFSFGPAQVTYVAKGKGSWKHAALNTEQLIDREDDIFPYREEFLTSHWKLFHDALQAHHFHVLHELLPRYGICAA